MPAEQPKKVEEEKKAPEVSRPSNEQPIREPPVQMNYAPREEQTDTFIDAAATPKLFDKLQEVKQQSETVVRSDIDSQRENFQKRLAQRNRASKKTIGLKSSATMSQFD